MNSITLIGSIKGEPAYTEPQIFELLQTPQMDLGYGETFTGRPGTRLHLDDKHIIKVKSRIHLDRKSSICWATKALQQEQRLQIYHPSKTWFVADDAETALIGNICPRLTPLHVRLRGLEKSQGCLDYLKALFQHYFRVGEAFKLRLDEGLSNFGLCEDGTLYYLDDDTYKWDRFISCSQMLGVYIRSLPCLTPALGHALGQILRELILQYFNDPQYLTVLAEQLRDVFLSDQQRPIATSLINGLNEQKTVSPFVNKFGDFRYIALLADIHANLPALEAVLDFLESKGIHQGIVLGDIVGYGPHPAACIERIQAMDKNFIILKGNHDHALATGQFSKGFSKTANWALDWNSKRVSTEQKKWLLELPPVFRHENWLALHGAPVDPTFFNAYVYETTYENNLDALQKKAIQLCFHGHTHLPGVYGRIGEGFDKYEIDENIALDKFTHALVCPGSVGQPRNRQFGAQFAIYDQVQKNVQFYSLDYDQQKTVQDMQAGRFPAFLINFLV
ncbi:MAG: metallophosphoesterase family protein [Pseudomonadota bacterium]